jgi:hypothetical protein
MYASDTYNEAEKIYTHSNIRENGRKARGIAYEMHKCQDLPDTCDLEPEGPLNPSDSDCYDPNVQRSDNHLVAYSRRGESFPCNSRPKLTSFCSQPTTVYLKVCEGVPLDKDRLDYACQRQWFELEERMGQKKGTQAPGVCTGEDPEIQYVEGNKSIGERFNFGKNPFVSHEATFEGLVWGGKSIQYKR